MDTVSFSTARPWRDAFAGPKVRIGNKVKNSVAGKVVIIVDASTPNGAAAAYWLAIRGANLILGSPKQRIHLVRELAHELQWNGGSVAAVECPRHAMAKMEVLIRSAIEHYGRLDVVVSNAAHYLHPCVPSVNGVCGGRPDPLELQENLYAVAASLIYFPRLQYQEAIRVIFEMHIGSRDTSSRLADLMPCVDVLAGMANELEKYKVWLSVIYTRACQGSGMGRLVDAETIYDDSSCPGGDIASESFARSLCFVIDQPLGANVDEVTIG